MAFQRGKACLAAAVKNVIIDGSKVPLAKFITEGPLYGRCLGQFGGQSFIGSPTSAADDAVVDLAQWSEAGDVLLTKVLGKALEETHQLTEAEAVRIYQYYLPVYFWIQSLLDAHQATNEATTKKPLTVGLSCPQGGGKTTLVDALNALFVAHGKKCADMSLDDFYLTRDEQVALSTSEEGAGNGLLELRGNPGTHDLPLALSTLKALQVPTQTQE